jgi:hypothetical protein
VRRVWERSEARKMYKIATFALPYTSELPPIPMEMSNNSYYSVFWDEWIISQYKVYVLRSNLNHTWFWGSRQNLKIFLFFSFHCANLHVINPYFPYLDRCPRCRLSGGKFLLCKQKKFCFLNFQLCALQIKISNNQIIFDWACMPTVYCYPVKLTIADLIRCHRLSSAI